MIQKFEPCVTRVTQARLELSAVSLNILTLETKYSEMCIRSQYFSDQRMTYQLEIEKLKRVLADIVLLVK